MKIKKLTNNFLLYLLLFFVFLSCKTNQEINEYTKEYNLTGKKTKNASVWKIEFYYNEKNFKVSFFKRGLISLPNNEYEIEISINEKKYSGEIIRKNPFFGSDYYKIDIFYDSQIQGSIKKKYNRKYRIDDIELRSGDSKINGFIEYKPLGNQTIEVIFKNRKLTGISKYKNNIKEVEYQFGKHTLQGEIKKEFGYDTYRFQAIDLDDNDMFIFLLLETYQIIDKFETNS